MTGTMMTAILAEKQKFAAVDWDSAIGGKTYLEFSGAHWLLKVCLYIS
jgi:hypothetical protein